MATIAGRVRQYDEGDRTLKELLLDLILAAAEQTPEEIASHLGPEHLAAVRAATARPPSSPEGMMIVRIGGASEAQLRKDQFDGYHGAWARHDYFRRLDAAVFA